MPPVKAVPGAPAHSFQERSQARALLRISSSTRGLRAYGTPAWPGLSGPGGIPQRSPGALRRAGAGSCARAAACPQRSSLSALARRAHCESRPRVPPVLPVKAVPGAPRSSLSALARPPVPRRAGARSGALSRRRRHHARLLPCGGALKSPGRLPSQARHARSEHARRQREHATLGDGVVTPAPSRPRSPSAQRRDSRDPSSRSPAGEPSGGATRPPPAPPRRRYALHAHRASHDVLGNEQEFRLFIVQCRSSLIGAPQLQDSPLRGSAAAPT